MAHKLTLAATSRRDDYLIVTMLCPDCPRAAFGSKLEDAYGDHDAETVAILEALGQVQRLHDYDIAEKEKKKEKEEGSR